MHVRLWFQSTCIKPVLVSDFSSKYGCRGQWSLTDLYKGGLYTFGHVFWALSLLILYSRYDLFYFHFQRVSNLGTDHRIVQIRKQFPWCVWANIICLRFDSFANCLPKLSQKASYPPVPHHAFIACPNQPILSVPQYAMNQLSCSEHIFGIVSQG